VRCLRAAGLCQQLKAMQEMPAEAAISGAVAIIRG